MRQGIIGRRQLVLGKRPRSLVAAALISLTALRPENALVLVNSEAAHRYALPSWPSARREAVPDPPGTQKIHKGAP